jgi:hypothetical protein
MAITKNAGRQYPLVATVTFDATDIPAVAVYEAIDLPVGAIITGGVLEVVTVDGGGGTVKVQVGSTVLLAATASTPASRTFITETPVMLTAPDTVDVEVETAVLTTGAFRLSIEYILDGRAHEAN